MKGSPPTGCRCSGMQGGRQRDTWAAAQWRRGSAVSITCCAARGSLGLLWLRGRRAHRAQRVVGAVWEGGPGAALAGSSSGAGMGQAARAVPTSLSGRLSSPSPVPAWAAFTCSEVKVHSPREDPPLSAAGQPKAQGPWGRSFSWGTAWYQPRRAGVFCRMTDLVPVFSDSVFPSLKEAHWSHGSSGQWHKVIPGSCSPASALPIY